MNSWIDLRLTLAWSLLLVITALPFVAVALTINWIMGW